MSLCDDLVGVPDSCGDNNLGSIKRVLIADFDDITTYTPTDTGTDPDTDGEVTAITMASGTKFEEFILVKDTSMWSEEDVIDLVADTNSWSQTVTLGLRRIDLRKRNALQLLVTGRRNLVTITEDFNGDYWIQGLDQGMRMSAGSKTTNETRSAGQALPTTLTSENEKFPAYKVDSAIIDDLLTAAA